MTTYGNAFRSVLLLFFATQMLGQNQPIVRQIQLTSAASGLQGTRTTDVLIQKDGDAYLRAGEPVDAARVVALVKAMEAPGNSEPNLSDLGITPAWLKANAPLVAQKESGSLIDGATPNLAALESAFADPETMDKIALGLFRTIHTDGHPFVDILVTFTDGSTIRARTGSQWPFLLPWFVINSDKQWRAYNADISRAVAALLPEKTTNRDRLAGNNLDTLLAQPLMVQISAKDRMTKVEAQTGSALSTIRTKYTILGASLRSLREPISGKAEPEQASLLLDVRSPNLPPYVREQVMLPFTDGHVVGADEFLRDTPQFEKLTVSVPWLNQYLLQSELHTPLNLFITHGVSFTDAAFRLFSADMQAIGREDLVLMVSSLKGRIALVSVGSGIPASQWLVFPDGHMILWRYELLPTVMKTLLKWSVSDIPSKPCSESGPFLGCVGRVVSPGGDLN